MIKIVPMVLLGFALSVQAQGDFKVTRVSQGNSQPVVFSLDYPVIKSGAPTIVKAETFFQADRVIELEGWMFNDNYLQADASNQVEAWMTDKDYLDSESPNPVENWMMDSKYLDNETVLPVESWMLNDSYLTKR